MSNKNENNGSLGLIVGITAGIAAVAAGSFAAYKIANEIKKDSHETTIISPDERNYVTITCGSSDFARGLTLVKIKAENEKDECNLSFLVGKSANKISFAWENDDHLEFCIGDGKVKKICSVSFAGEEIEIKLYRKKI